MLPLEGSSSITGDKDSGSRVMAAATAFKLPYSRFPKVTPPWVKEPLIKACVTDGGDVVWGSIGTNVE